MNLLQYLQAFRQAQQPKKQVPYTRERQSSGSNTSSDAPFSIPKPVTTVGSHMVGNAISNAVTGGSTATGSGVVATPTIVGGGPAYLLPGGAAPSASSVLSTMGGLGASAGLAGMAYAVGDNFLQNGGKDLMRGDIRKDNSINAALDTNPMTGWMNPVGKAFGIGTVGGLLGGKSLKEKNFEDLKDNVWDKGIKTHHSGSLFDTANKRGEVDSRFDTGFVGKSDDGEWINNKFAQSRSVNDLRAEDVWGATDVYKVAGNDWLGKLNEDQRRAVSQSALDQGLFNEGGGRVYLNGDAAKEAFKGLVDAELSKSPIVTPTASKPRRLTSKTSASSTAPKKDKKKKKDKQNFDLFEPPPVSKDPTNAAAVAVEEFAKALQQKHRYV